MNVSGHAMAALRTTWRSFTLLV